MGNKPVSSSAPPWSLHRPCLQLLLGFEFLPWFPSLNCDSGRPCEPNKLFFSKKKMLVITFYHSTSKLQDMQQIIFLFFFFFPPKVLHFQLKQLLIHFASQPFLGWVTAHSGGLKPSTPQKQNNNKIHTHRKTFQIHTLIHSIPNLNGFPKYWERRSSGETTFLRAPACFQADRSSSLPFTESAARAWVYSRVKSTFTMQLKCSATGRRQHRWFEMPTFWTQENVTCPYLSLHV